MFSRKHLNDSVWVCLSWNSKQKTQTQVICHNWKSSSF